MAIGKAYTDGQYIYVVVEASETLYNETVLASQALGLYGLLALAEAIMLLILIIILLLIAFAGAPNWGWHQYGYYPSGLVGVILIILVVLLLMGRL